VAKILVADDNSNVQKTVALALGDLGVDIIAVNNGDAAIRKLADVSPDLVLADIFMPVRNGYEVCEYVKKDTRLTNVPVVLLVGAFDPLDEREAQRVGADGILKKPFVPPDPLITMVKTLLDRSLSERLVAVSVSKPAAPVTGKAGGATTGEVQPGHVEAPSELPKDEFPPPTNRVSFGEGNHPVAFSQLLETPTQEPAAGRTETVDPVDDDQVLTSRRDAALGDPIFWEPEESQTDEENPEEEEQSASDTYGLAWEQAGDVALAEQPASHQEPEPAHKPAHEAAESFELVRDDQDETSNQHPSIVEPSSLVQDPASQAPLTVAAGKAEDLAANPIEWMATAPPVHAEEPPVDAPELDEFASEDTADVVEPVEMKSVAQPEPILPPSSIPLAPPFPAPPLAVSVSAAVPTMPEPKIEDQTQARAKTRAPFDPFAQSTEDTARSISQQQWSDLAASLQFKSSDSATEKPKPSSPAAMPPQVPVQPAGNTQVAPQNPAASTASTPPAAPDPALVEAVVQRVLDKMRPQVVDIITKEFLRPVVQALVHREIEKQ
jgi:CheY-like chemotaxis protein